MKNIKEYNVAFTEKEIDMICKYYGVYNFEEDENILTYQERKILVDRFVKEWDKKIEKAYEDIFIYPNQEIIRLRKYIDYLNEQMHYWKKAEKDADSEQEKLRCQMMWESFREKIEKEKEKSK